MSRDREKLTERINNTDYVFSKKVNSFQEAYPTIASLRIEVTESSFGFGSSSRTWTFTEANFRHAINCSNSMCYGDGVELGWMLHDMVRKKQIQHEERKGCQGYEGSPKGRRRYRSCLHSFQIKAQVEYKKRTTRMLIQLNAGVDL